MKAAEVKFEELPYDVGAVRVVFEDGTFVYVMHDRNVIQ